MSELASYLRQNCSPWWSRYVSMRKSGQSAGARGSDGSAVSSTSGRCGLSCRPKRMSHSGPERYVMVAISMFSEAQCQQWGALNIKRERGKAYGARVSGRCVAAADRNRSRCSNSDPP